MSPQDTQILQDFLNQLTQVRGIAKDPQAASMIAAAVAQQPDAAYLLVQRALLMEQALASSKEQIAALQSQLAGLQQGTSAAPGFFDSNAWGHAPAAPVRATPAPAQAAMPAYAPPPAPMQPAPQYQSTPAPAPSTGFLGGGMGSMLGTVAATAAGVAGGAFLYQGIEHMMNRGSGSNWMNQNASNTPTEKIENTTVNNYYGSDADKKSGDSNSVSDTASSSDFSDLRDIDLSDNSDYSDGGYDDSVV